MSQLRGKVKFFHEKKGFGFITHDKEDFFVHFKDIQSNAHYKNLETNQEVTFDKVKTERGWAAINVKVV